MVKWLGIMVALVALLVGCSSSDDGEDGDTPEATDTGGANDEGEGTDDADAPDGEAAAVIVAFQDAGIDLTDPQEADDAPAGVTSAATAEHEVGTVAVWVFGSQDEADSAVESSVDDELWSTCGGIVVVSPSDGVGGGDDGSLAFRLGDVLRGGQATC